MEEALARGRQLIRRLELIQYQYFNGRAQWTNIKLEDLKLYMAYTYFGYPAINTQTEELNDVIHEIDKINDNIFDYYNDEEKKKIIDMIMIINKNIIRKTVTHIDVGFTITHSICKMCCNVCQDFPNQDIHQWYLLRIKLDNQSVAYIDLLHKRTYKNWSDYLENNTLPKGFMFYPQSGFYEESAFLIQNLTPPSKNSEKILSSFDRVGNVATFVSGVLFGCGLFFPIMSPVMLPASAVIGTFSAWEIGRQINKLSDLGSHNESLVSEQAVKSWMNLAVATLGVITAPLNATIRTLELSNSAIMSTRIGNSLSILQKGACITQCSLEVIRITTSILVYKNKLTFNDIMGLRLDLFIVTGSLMPVRFILELLECMIAGIWCPSLYRQVVDLPICVGQYILKAACFIGKHFNEFSGQLVKFLKNELTSEKLLFGLKTFFDFINSYKKQLSGMNADDLLTHIVNDTGILPPNVSNDVKSALCSDHMKTLLREKFPNKATDQNFVKFCVKHVMEKAQTTHMAHRQAIAECERHGFTDYDRIELEFCQVYGLKRCNMAEFVLCGIQNTANDVVNFLKAYEEHCSRPENKYKELLVASHSENSRTINTFCTVPPSNELDAAMCTDLAQIFDQRNSEYNNFSYVQPQSNVSVLFSASRFSIKMVIFKIDTYDRVPTLNISFYRDSGTSVNNQLM